MLRRRAMMGSGGGLPKRYQELEYIEARTRATVNAYINTKVLAIPPLKIKAVMGVSSGDGSTVPNSYKRVAFGATEGSSNDYYGLRVSIYSSYKNLYYLTKSNELGVSANVVDDTMYEVEADWTSTGLKVYFDNTLLVTSTNPCGLSSYPIYLFGSNGAGSAGYGGYGRMKSVQITRNGVLVRDLVACRDTQTQKIGMYDLVNDVFYSNAGTGNDFIAGPDV